MYIHIHIYIYWNSVGWIYSPIIQHSNTNSVFLSYFILLAVGFGLFHCPGRSCHGRCRGHHSAHPRGWRSAPWRLAEPCRPRPGLWCRWRRCTPGSPMFQWCHRWGLWAWDLWDPWGSKVMRRNTGRNCNMSCWVDVGVLVEGVCFDLGWWFRRW